MFKNNKKGFTLVELLAVIVILAVVILIAVTAVIPRMNNAKKKALFTEAILYLREAKNSYSLDEGLTNSSNCINVSALNEENIKKSDSSKYKGAIQIEESNGVVTQKIYLTNGDYYVVGNENLTLNDVTDEKPAGFLTSCGDYNPVLASNVDTNSLAYKLINSQTGSTFEEKIANIEERTENVNFTVTSFDSTNSGMFKAEDDDGATFYYRGANIPDNYVNFGGYLWRVLRINGDGSIRLISQGLINNDFRGIFEGLDAVQYITAEKYVDDVSGLTSNKIKTEYQVNYTGIGYMYDKYQKGDLILSHDYKPSSTNPVTGFSNIARGPYQTLFLNANPTTMYFFANFNEGDCQRNDNDPAICTLKCRNIGDDCIYSNFASLASNPENYSTDAADGSTNNLLVYTGKYRYICHGTGEFNYETVSNIDGTTSVYVSCSTIAEIFGGYTLTTTTNTYTNESRTFINVGSNVYGRTWKYDILPLETDSSLIKDDTNLKKVIDKWYEDNILNATDGKSTPSSLESYLVDGLFCSDRNFYSRKSNPTYKCMNIKENGYTLGNQGLSSVSPKGKGNQKLKYPIATVTADDLAFAGYKYNSYVGNFISEASNNVDWEKKDIWTMTPYNTYTFVSYNVSTNSHPKLYYSSRYNEKGVRIVINLRPDVQVESGGGFMWSPYVISLPSE